MKLTDAATNWSFECLTDSGGKPLPGGLVLRQVTHDGHNFAKDIRVIGFWMETELVDPSGKKNAPAKKFYTLDSATFTVSSVRTLIPKAIYNPTYKKTFDYLKESDAALDFSTYFKDSGGNYVAFGVAAKFDAPGLLNSFPNCEYADLTLEQIFLFSRYSNAPRHEPSGALSAARFHPLVSYTFSKNAAYDAKKPYTRVNSIRFDYRLQLFLDRHYDAAKNAALPQLGNQAGLFADSDSAVGTVVASVGSGIWNILQKNTAATAVSSGAFDSVEKPIVLEVTTPGLAKGFPAFMTTTSSGSSLKVRCWDNVHWWGSRGPGGTPVISAPGAFHAAHVHWRWGAAVKASGVGSNPVFNPTTYPAGMKAPAGAEGMWGPLVDPGIWIQSLNIAVVKNDPSLDPNLGIPLNKLSKDDWKSLFPAVHSTPDDISVGDDLVLWYSTEVHHDLTLPSSSTSYTSKPSGTVFLHGIFFAHDAEKTGMTVGSTDPAYRPASAATIRSSKLWVRTAG